MVAVNVQNELNRRKNRGRAVEYIRSVHSGPCMMELNVNRRNRALHFYERMGMRRLREGDFPIGDGYYMNDYIMGLEIV